MTKMKKLFPAPLEVDRELYVIDDVTDVKAMYKFPAPLEVDREIYF